MTFSNFRTDARTDYESITMEFNASNMRLDEVVEVFIRFLKATGFEMPTQFGHFEWTDPDVIGSGMADSTFDLDD